MDGAKRSNHAEAIPMRANRRRGPEKGVPGRMSQIRNDLSVPRDELYFKAVCVGRTLLHSNNKQSAGCPFSLGIIPFYCF